MGTLKADAGKNGNGLRAGPSASSRSKQEDKTRVNFSTGDLATKIALSRNPLRSDAGYTCSMTEHSKF